MKVHERFGRTSRHGELPGGEAGGIALGPYLRSGEPLPDRSVYCDIGRELSAYRRDGFLRARSAAGAWGIEPGDGEPPQLSWTRYAWRPDGRAVQLPGLGSVDGDVLAHVGRAVPMQPAPQTEEALEALRALGYTE